MAAPALDNYFVQDASRLEGEVYRIMRARGRVSALMQKRDLPDGIGYNFSTTVVKRSTATGGSGWIDVAQENGTVNNCVPNPSTVAPAQTVLNYNAQQQTVFSSDICFNDARRGYDFKSQVQGYRDNFVAEIVDTWENRDKLAFFQAAGHKLVFNASLTENTNSTTMPNVAATYQINQTLLDVLYERISQDGGYSEPYARKQGAPLITAIMSMGAHRTIIKTDDSVREDFRFADQGKGDGSVLLQSWGIDRAYGGFMHVIDMKMPRFDFVNGAYVERPYYTSTATTIGEEANVSAAYQNAEFEDLYLWDENVVMRQVPKPLGSVGADTRGTAVNFNGEVQWLNIPNKESNPFSNIGFWAAFLVAAYKPAKIQYGYVVRYKRCPAVTGSECPAY